MSNENNAPEALTTLPALKEAVHQKYAHLEPVMARHAQSRGSGSTTTDPSQTRYLSTDVLPTSSYMPEKEAEEKRICGLTQRNFMILCIVALVILGAGIGGGVGGGLAAQNNMGSDVQTPIASPSPSPTPLPDSSTSSSPAPSSSSIPLPIKLDCPKIDGMLEKFDKKWTFEYKCGKDITGSEYDIVYFTSYVLEDCVRACTSYNKNRNSNECTAVEFNADSKACAVKNATSGTPVNGASPTRQVLAVLQQ
ncbi:uncharacterized protein PG986_010599 [Apiospora aurea]|uniref:Apple domain-containing protein n=1 Tax=Apiospora aurea TaxID=335848 RepID=A0ABR1Q2Q6_9PEZI